MQEPQKTQDSRADTGPIEGTADLEEAVSHIVEASGSSGAMVTLWHEAEDRPTRVASYGLDAQLCHTLERYLSQKLSDLAARTQPIPVEVDASKLDSEVAARLGPLHLLVFPLQHHGELAGLLCLVRPKPEAEEILHQPGLYRVLIDEVNVIVQNAWLVQQLLRERQEAEQLQSVFLSVISHELQSPISIIKGYADILSEDVENLNPTQIREKLSVIREEADRLGKMVGKLLHASRIQAGGMRLRLEPVDLRRLIKKVAHRMGGLSDKHAIVLDIPRHLPPILADYEQVQEVLLNLLDNALKYSPLGGTVTVSARQQGDEIIVSVADQGIGIPEQDRDRLFQRFSRLDSRFVRQVKGTGLGLYICKAIVEAHGGRIWAEAVNGGGSRFSFSLPLRRPAAALQAAPAAAATA
jgi:signal transduction histidine kinase